MEDLIYLLRFLNYPRGNRISIKGLKEKKSHTKLVFWKNNFAQGMEDAMEEIVLQEKYQ